MDFSSDQGNQSSSITPSARILVEKRDQILDDWGVRVREKIDAAAELQEPILFDSLPVFLDNLAEALSVEHPRRLATDSTNVAQEHGSERARLSRYGPDQLIREYHLLRDVIIAHLSASIELSAKERQTIQKSVDEAVCEAMMAFYLVQSRVREQFVATLTHDLRNPLGAAKMSAEVILNFLGKRDLDDATREDLGRLARRIINSTKRADRMIQDLLDVSVIQVGETLPIALSDFDMLKIIQDVIVELPLEEQARILVSGSSVRGTWDGNGLRRAIENLLNNAIKYGSGTSPISVTLTETRQRVMVHVHNEGNAIPVEEQELLFQAYRRSQSAKSSGKRGWGIGLALVRGVAEAHGGGIAVDSSPDRGTTFIIDIPIDARPFQGSTTIER